MDKNFINFYKKYVLYKIRFFAVKIKSYKSGKYYIYDGDFRRIVNQCDNLLKIYIEISKQNISNVILDDILKILDQYFEFLECTTVWDMLYGRKNYLEIDEQYDKVSEIFIK